VLESVAWFPSRNKEEKNKKIKKKKIDGLFNSPFNKRRKEENEESVR